MILYTALWLMGIRFQVLMYICFLRTGSRMSMVLEFSNQFALHFSFVLLIAIVILDIA